MAVSHTTTEGIAERERIMAALRRRADELRGRGVRRLRLTGSIASGAATATSDVDLIAEIDRGRVQRFSLLDLAVLELDLTDALGREVQITTSLDELHPLFLAQHGSSSHRRARRWLTIYAPGLIHPRRHHLDRAHDGGRNLERISEAPRHLPDTIKDVHPEMPWRQIAQVGNIL
jgi:uncharacterized protein